MIHTILAYLLIIFFIFTFCLDFCRNKRTAVISYDYFYLSSNTTTALKGIAAIIIVCHHYCLYQYNYVDHKFVTALIPMNGGNFSLIIFLFLSGYGVTKSELAKPKNISQFFRMRFWKVLKPCLIIYGITFLAYFFLLPDGITEYDIKQNWLNPYVIDISSHNISLELLLNWFCIKMDWYVYTTLVLYVFFYLTTFIYPLNDDSKVDSVKMKRILLLLLMICLYSLLSKEIFP